ncbi:MAG TPA: hypothetical protein EYP14_07330, partial [Planctomycetaceae bacterium]|nr:hypothetical protein [Planctomycetaceae bacterium]
MTVTESINVRQVLLEGESFGPQDVVRLQRAIHHHAGEVRQLCRELLERIDAGESTPENLRACGITSYLLADHGTAERCLRQLDGDGMAEFYLAKTLMVLGRYEEADELFRRAGDHGWDPVDCTLQR